MDAGAPVEQGEGRRRRARRARRPPRPRLFSRRRRSRPPPLRCAAAAAAPAARRPALSQSEPPLPGTAVEDTPSNPHQYRRNTHKHTANDKHKLIVVSLSCFRKRNTQASTNDAFTN